MQVRLVETRVEAVASSEKNSRLMKVAQWIGFFFGLSGATLLALKMPISGWAYIIFSIADIGWIVTAVWKRIPGLMALHSGYLVINAIGLYRWFV